MAPSNARRLSALFASLSDLPFEHRAKDLELCAAGFVIDNRSFPDQFLASKFSDLLDIQTPARVRRVGEMYFIRFSNSSDRRKALECSPLNIDDAFFAIQPWRPFSIPGTIRCEDTAVWVQIHGLPFELRDEQHLLRLGSYIGVVEVIEHPKDDMMEEFCRVKVRFSPTEPLLSGMFIRIPTRDIIRVNYAYEGVSRLCFSCRRIGHTFGQCSEKSRVRTNEESFGENSVAAPSLIPNATLNIPSLNPNHENSVHNHLRRNIITSSPHIFRNQNSTYPHHIGLYFNSPLPFPPGPWNRLNLNPN